YQWLKNTAELGGDACEIGVYKGGTARLIARSLASTTKTVHLFDTFVGMPKTDPLRDLHREGQFADTSIESVKEVLQDCKNVRFYPGRFPETADPIRKSKF